MWSVASRIQTGECHIKRGMMCQDQVEYKTDGISHIAVLADGAGDTDMNVYCVSEVINRTARRLLDIIGNVSFFNQPKADMIRMIMNDNICILSKYMKEYKLTAKDVGSTLLGVAVNQNTGQYLLIHLGDGIIIGRSRDNVRVMSYPMNGRADQTFLTISENVVDYMRVFRGNVGDLDQIFLCSDGVYDYPVSNTFVTNDIWNITEKGAFSVHKNDDQSYIGLRRSQNDNIGRYT